MRPSISRADARRRPRPWLVSIALAIASLCLGPPGGVGAGPPGTGPGAASSPTPRPATGSAPTITPAFRPVFTHLTVDDGLPENTVRRILQDDLGFLWFGTQSGVARYDGAEMAMPWHPELPRVMTSALLEAHDGTIWIGSVLNGLWRLDPRTERVVQIVRPEAVRTRGPLGSVTGLTQDDVGAIWASWSPGGLSRIDPATASVTWSGDGGGDRLPSRQITAVLADRHGRLWVGTGDNGLFLRERGRQGWLHLRHDPHGAESLLADAVQALLETSDGRVWVLTAAGLSSWLPERRGFENLIPNPGGRTAENFCLDAAGDGQGGLWLGTAAGLWHLDGVSGRFTLHAHDPADRASPVKGPVLSVCRDRVGVVWAGSWHAGLNKLDPHAQKFRYLDHDPTDPGSLDDSAVAAVLEDRAGTLWVGTGSLATGGSNGALNELPAGATAFIHHRFPGRDDHFVRTVQALAEDREGELWLGTNVGLWRLDRAAGRPVRMYASAPDTDPDRRRIGDVAVRSLHCDSAGNLWVGAVGGGLYRVAPGGDPIDQFQTGAAGQPSSPLATPVVIHEDRARNLWVGTDSQGLYRFDPAAASLERFFAPQRGLAVIIDIHEDARGRLWLGTYGGLLQFDPGTSEVVRVVGTDAGLPHGVVASILEDDQGRLWLSTGRGLCRFDPQTGVVQAFDRRDGLPSNELAFAHARRRDGTLVFGNPAGLVPFRPRDIALRGGDPRVVITGLQIGGQRVGPASSDLVPVATPYLEAVTLPHDRNDLTVAFATLDFTHPERNRYRYRLLQDDPAWRDADHRRSVTYTNLAPGRYRFEVQGTNGDGVWSTRRAALDLVVRPPWWRTTWARALWLLLVGLLAVAIYRQVVQRERMRAALAVERTEAQKLQELERFKSRFFANVTHEFRTPLTLLRGPLERLQADPASGDPGLFAMMARNTERLGQLIDQLLDLSRLDARSLPLRFAAADCVAFVRNLTASFASLAAARDLRFTTSLPQDPVPCWFDGDLLEKVVGNLLINAIKFTPAGESVRLELGVGETVSAREVPGTGDPAPARRLRLVVANTGSFIPARELERIFERFHQVGDGATGTGAAVGRGAAPWSGSGIGLALVRELVEWHGGTVTATSDPHTGTCFVVSLPVFMERPVPAPETEATAPADRAAGPPTGTAAEPDAPVVLVVEDSADLRDYLARELAPSYRVLLASDGAEGLERARVEIPDLVVSDVMMPGLDGFALCEALREDERTCHVPVVLLTALAATENRREGLRHGADAYLAKPFDVEELAIRIENLIAQRRRLARIYAGRVTDLAPDALPVVSADDRFLQRAREAVEKHLDDENLQVEDLCREVGLSRSQFHRKLKALTGQSATAFIRAHRLQRAADLLAGGYGNVTEVAFAVGFQSLSYFARCFREQYGMPPSVYPQRDR
jgi:signal transduction histidine kinase/ligand-binding sensor domain-containing protein/DNA-binding response OmpR family regulator